MYPVGVVWCGKGVVYLTSPGVQVILACSWARPGILVAGKGRGECFYFFCFFTFIPVPFSFLSSFISSTSISFLPFSERRHKMTHKSCGVIKPQHSQSVCTPEESLNWMNTFCSALFYFILSSIVAIRSLSRKTVMSHLIWIYTVCKAPLLSMHLGESQRVVA